MNQDNSQIATSADAGVGTFVKRLIVVKIALIAGIGLVLYFTMFR